jgi:PIN domain nuclease of toxin-antitoxin system
VKLLLETHTFLWHADGDPQMSAAATALLVDPANELFLSMASVWEIAIKTGPKKLSLSAPFVTFMQKAITGYGITLVPMTLDDCAAYEQLPFPDQKHRDPFDRMIVVHALRNGLSVVGIDSALDAYGITRLW